VAEEPVKAIFALDVIPQASCTRAGEPCCKFVFSCYALEMARRASPLVTRSFRIDPNLVAAARRATGAKDDTEAVRVALAEVVERARLRRWVRKVAGKGRLHGADA
jgi:Bacterial antitoxin of type II TA system, VapB